MHTKTSRHILELSVQEQKDFINSFDFVLSDCDGVVWLILSPLPNTGRTINLLKSEGKKCIFVTNNSFNNDEQFLEKFASVGTNLVKSEDVINPNKAIAMYLKKYKPGERVFSVNNHVANEVFRNNGIDIETLDITDNLDPASLARLIKPEQKVGAVVIDINFNLNYAELAKAYQYLLDKDCELIMGGSDTHMPMSADMATLGFVDFAKYLSKYSHKQPIALGKPSPRFGDIIKEMYNITTPKRCLFIGDSLSSDIAFGTVCGFQTLLVLSGTSTKEEMLVAEENLRPDYYADSLADFIELFQNIKLTNNNIK
ncbi:4-nitrophenylphosphatase-like isoform X1 [Teleopsis dalmanni]|uniref:4-nitrophenylphosphatase-like isoform X1 n=1 Tax=Teleopsis dalmanni TaxID=139649 RepID=UPI0018CF15EA|nr:4-nitrophenylphosphatase-like isoform X1 [Teleopsis dalmanni]